MVSKKDRVRGCIIGGAVGDALGAPIEFRKLKEIHKKYGPEGLTNFVSGDYPLGSVTDDTQMSLFTGEGLLEAEKAKVKLAKSASKESYFYLIDKKVHAAYLRWLKTQTSNPFNQKRNSSKLIGDFRLYVNRAPGITCLTSLKNADKVGVCQIPRNNSKGSGGVMRVAPVGALGSTIGSNEDVFIVGMRTAWLTHQHPCGYLSAGFLAVMVRELIDGSSLEKAFDESIEQLQKFDNQNQVKKIVLKAKKAAKLSETSNKPLHKILKTSCGEGWVGEEALAIAIFCLFATKSYKDGVILAVNHDGDSDTTGAVAGNLLGSYYGVQTIPKVWSKNVELLDILEDMSDKLYLASKAEANSDG